MRLTNNCLFGICSKIRETLNNLILVNTARALLIRQPTKNAWSESPLPPLRSQNSPQDWQTNVALPFVKITGTVRVLFRIERKWITKENALLTSACAYAFADCGVGRVRNPLCGHLRRCVW